MTYYVKLKKMEAIIVKPILLSPMNYGKYCAVQLPNGKEYRRVVRYGKKEGLYVVIANRIYKKVDMTVAYKEHD